MPLNTNGKPVFPHILDTLDNSVTRPRSGFEVPAKFSDRLMMR
jgi:hypothetical protein